MKNKIYNILYNNIEIYIVKILILKNLLFNFEDV